MNDETSDFIENTVLLERITKEDVSLVYKLLPTYINWDIEFPNEYEFIIRYGENIKLFRQFVGYFLTLEEFGFVYLRTQNEQELVFGKLYQKGE